MIMMAYSKLQAKIA